MTKITTPLVAVAAVCLLLAVVAIGWTALSATKQQHEITVDKMWTKMHIGADDIATEKYLVSDTEGNVYCVADAPTFGKFDASDRWAQLDVDNTYIVTTIGWRIPIASMYPNIIEIDEV